MARAFQIEVRRRGARFAACANNHSTSFEPSSTPPARSGHETRGQRVWMEYAKQYADETFSDAYGNCVAVLNKGGSPRLMLAGACG